jgi:hypothetical protein
MALCESLVLVLGYITWSWSGRQRQAAGRKEQGQQERHRRHHGASGGTGNRGRVVVGG